MATTEKEKYDMGPLVIVAPQWVLEKKAFISFVKEAREHGAYVDVIITGHPTPPPCPPSNPHCK